VGLLALAYGSHFSFLPGRIPFRLEPTPVEGISESTNPIKPTLFAPLKSPKILVQTEHLWYNQSV
jgi:hypothetical protein